MRKYPTIVVARLGHRREQRWSEPQAVRTIVVAGLPTEPQTVTEGLPERGRALGAMGRHTDARETYGRPPRRGQETHAELGALPSLKAPR
jgi:hypothetical protein